MGLDVFGAMQTQLSVRDFTDEPVSEADLERIIEAATWAPNAGNRQLFEFIIVRDPELRKQVAEIYRRSMETLEYSSTNAFEYDPDPRIPFKSMLKWARHLVEHLHEVPVIIIVGFDRSRHPYSTDGVFREFTHETVITGVMPAVQNLMLAARALDLGTCLTTVANIYAGKLKELLNVPPSVQLVALLPLGHPGPAFTPWRPVKRLPAQEKMHFDGW